LELGIQRIQAKKSGSRRREINASRANCATILDHRTRFSAKILVIRVEKRKNGSILVLFRPPNHVRISQNSNHERDRAGEGDVNPDPGRRDPGDHQEQTHSQHHITASPVRLRPHAVAAERPRRANSEEEVRPELREEIPEDKEERANRYGNEPSGSPVTLQ
jgi:hypothetical protein